LRLVIYNDDFAVSFHFFPAPWLGQNSAVYHPRLYVMFVVPVTLRPRFGPS
jgi:hypothetical protein